MATGSLARSSKGRSLGESLLEADAIKIAQLMAFVGQPLFHTRDFALSERGHAVDFPSHEALLVANEANSQQVGHVECVGNGTGHKFVGGRRWQSGRPGHDGVPPVQRLGLHGRVNDLIHESLLQPLVARYVTSRATLVVKRM